VAAELGTSERTLQRALRHTIGLGPNDVARRIRLQEVVRRLNEPDPNMARISADLGYTDQAHLINEFRTVSGTTPGRYLRLVRAAEDRLRALSG
jgi:AraC-like DNA-binding protein